MVLYYTVYNKQLKGEYEHTCVFELKSMHDVHSGRVIAAYGSLR